MKTALKILLASGLAASAFAMTAASASAEAILDLQINRAAELPVPVTHSDERLAYEAKLKNLASPVPGVGTTLTCLGTAAEGINWGGTPAPTFAFRWLRDGAPIPGEEGPWPAAPAKPTYVLTGADAGKSIQCEVIATNDADGAGTTYAPISAIEITHPPTQVAPVPVPAPPSGSAKASLGGSGAKGSILTCTAPGGWSGTGISWTFQWLRNGEPAPHAPLETTATTSKYELQEADVNPPASMQCVAVAEDSAGNRAVVTSNLIRTEPEVPEPYVSPFPPQGSDPHPSVGFNNQTEGKVSVKMVLPAGAKAIQVAGTKLASQWECTKAPASEPSTATCSREDPLAPGDTSESILFVAQVSKNAADSITTEFEAFGGGALSPDTAEDTVSGILPAVPFGFKAFETMVLDEAGNDFHTAGGHPFSAGAHLEFNDHVKPQPSAEAGFRPANGSVREVRTDVPPGFVGNPQALGPEGLCPSTSDVVAIPTSCPAASAVGGIKFKASTGEYEIQPIYAIVPERGTPAQFAFGVGILKPGFVFTLTPELRPGDNYAVTLIASPGPREPELFEATVTLCNRGAKLENLSAGNGGETKFIRCWKASDPEALERPFLSLPTRCGDPASTTTTIAADSWEEPGKFIPKSFQATALDGCNALQFAPTVKAAPTTVAADSPSGLEFKLHLPQNEDPEGTATAHLKKAVVTLPEGFVVNPSGANGLGACSSAQIGLGTNDSPACPDSSKVGAVKAKTPILAQTLPGTLYIATPYDNPFNSLLALYLVIDDPQTGLVIKLAGRVEANKQTGQLTTSFDQNPQAPIEDVTLSLRAGATAPLRTPALCGEYSTTSELTPWSAPDSGPPASPQSAFAIEEGAGGAPCASSEAQLPNKPSFEAGTTSPLAGTYSPFVLKLRREDGSQQFSAITLSPPPGLVAKLAGVPPCSDGALAAAAAKTGNAEKSSPSCPAASEVGSVTAGAGAGPSPYYATGKVYLAGPYKGAPLSLAVITPAVAGPFDIGTVLIRTALYLDPATLQVTAKSDPLPQILEGIPLDVRSVVISIDKPNFMLNPTSCEAKAITGQVLTTAGQTAQLENRFQVAECGALKFKPKLKIQLHGGTQRGDYQRLVATVTYPKGPGYANIARASVAFPHSTFLAQEHIRTICTRVQFAAHTCPAGSIYGKAKATSPLVDYPLEGPVYLRSSSNPLPDVVIAFKGPAYQPIEAELAGRVDSKNGGIRNTFEVVPDAPVSKFTLEMRGGKKSLLVNSRNLCKSQQRATVRLTAQNGKTLNFRPLVGNDCGKGKGKPKGKR